MGVKNPAFTVRYSVKTETAGGVDQEHRSPVADMLPGRTVEKEFRTSPVIKTELWTDVVIDDVGL